MVTASDSPKLRIAVVGGGLGGLSFALACHRLGIQVNVYEQAAAFREIGNGVSLQRNPSILVNEFLDLETEYTAIAAPSADTHIDFRNWKSGELSESLKHPPGPINQRVHRVKRCEYLDMVRAPLPADQLHTKKRLHDIVRSGNTYTLHFEDGTNTEVDVVVGADGIHSPTRALLARALGKQPDKAVFSGQKVYRALIPKTSFTKEEQDMLFTGALNNFRGYDRHVLAGATGADAREINIVAFIPEVAMESESWTARGDVSVLKEELKDWCKPVLRIVEEMAKIDATCLKQALYYRAPLETWTDGSGLILIGDAAHPILPHQGSGTGMAIEDAVSLAMFLKDATKKDVGTRLKAFEQMRKPRTDVMLLNSIRMGKISSSDHADNITQDDKAMMTDRSFIWNYDARAEANKMLQSLNAVPAAHAVMA